MKTSPITTAELDGHLTGPELAFAMEYHGAEVDARGEPFYTPDFEAACDAAPGEYLETLLY